MNTTTHQPIEARNSRTRTGVSPVPPEPLQRAGGIALRAMQGEGEPVYLELRMLRLDERNVRKDPPTQAEVEELADLIDAQGLLQNLQVVEYEQPVKGTGKDKKRAYSHGVVAGGCRWRALHLLVKRGRITLDEQILCAVVPADRAVAVSAAENSGRTPMTTADTVLAFADMVRAGAGVEELAVCFGLSPLTVQRRLKLANVAPSLFGLFREGAMTLDQLMALALTDDHTAQEAAWAGASEYDRSPRKLRALIAGEGLSKAIMRFVGVPAYEAAGGAVLRDLFADGDDQPAYIQDAPLMMRLASEKLEGIAQGLRDQGAAWVDVFNSFTYTEREQYTAPPTSLRAMTEQEASEHAAIETEGEAIDTQLEALYDSDEESDENDAAIEALEAQSREVDQRREAIEQARRSVVPEVAALVGAVVYLDHNGEVKIERDRLRKADAAVAKRHSGKADAASGTAQPDTKGGVSDRLCHQLTAHRTRALQASLLGNQRAALAALVHPMLTRLVLGMGASYESPSALQVRAEDCEGQLTTWAPDLAGSRADQAVNQAVEAVKALLPAKHIELLPWLLAQPMDTLLQLLTLCSALSLNAINGSGKAATTEALANVLGLRMADWWAPTAGSYLGAVSKALLVEAVTEAGMPEEADGLAKLKKGEAVAKAEALLAGKGWVPSVLR